MKLCGHCSEWKANKMFPRNRSRADGLASWCKRCNNTEQELRKLRRSGVHAEMDVLGRLWIQPELPL